MNMDNQPNVNDLVSSEMVTDDNTSGNLINTNGTSGLEQFLIDSDLFPPLTDIDSFLLELDIDTSLIVDDNNSQWIGLWSRFCHLFQTTTSSAIRSMIERYGREFTTSLEFRSQFADAIERKCWDRIDVSNHQPGSESMRLAKAIVVRLREKVTETLSTTNMQLELTSRLRHWESQLESHYVYNPMDLVHLVYKMFRREKDILESALNQQIAPTPQMVGGGHPVENGPNVYGQPQTSQRAVVQMILKDITELEKQIRQVTLRLEKVNAEYQQLQYCTSGNVIILATPQNLQNPTNQATIASLTKRHTNLVVEKQEIIKCHIERFQRELTDLIRKIETEIAKWKRAEAHSANGKLMRDATDVDQLEECCRPIGQFLNACLDHIVKLHYVQLAQNDPNLQQLNLLQQNYELMVKQFVKNTLVVEKQPPQVLMKDKKFVCQLRHLMGQQMRFETKVWLINTEEAHSIMSGDDMKNINPSGTIVNNSAKSDYNDQTRQVFVHMRNMSLRMRQRGDRGRADCVAEEKFCMIFRSELQLAFPTNTACTVTAQTMSLPIVVISHGKQEADAQATIFWDNAFAEFQREPFAVPDAVRWDAFLKELDWFWKKNCRESGGTHREGFGLDEDAKKFLTMKLLGRDDRNVVIQWRQINRDNLTNQNFTFWTWLYKILELVSSPYVKKYWNLHLIKGFLSKHDCHRILHSCELGTFLFRFSDSTLGAVSIACYTRSKFSGLNEVGHLEPDTINKLKARSLPDMVKDINYLRFLYPNLSKDDAFGEFYTKDISGHDGYWPKKLVAVIGNSSDYDPANSSAPHTPQSNHGSHQYPFSPTASSTYSDAMSPPRHVID